MAITRAIEITPHKPTRPDTTRMRRNMNNRPWQDPLNTKMKETYFVHRLYSDKRHHNLKCSQSSCWVLRRGNSAKLIFEKYISHRPRTECAVCCTSFCLVHKLFRIDRSTSLDDLFDLAFHVWRPLCQLFCSVCIIHCCASLSEREQSNNAIIQVRSSETPTRTLGKFSKRLHGATERIFYKEKGASDIHGNF